MTVLGTILVDVAGHARKLDNNRNGGTHPLTDKERAERLNALCGALVTDTELGHEPDPLLLRTIAAEAFLWLERQATQEAAMPP